MVITATAIGAAIKFFGRDRKDADDDTQGDHPIVRRFFGAVNAGDYSEFADVIHEDCEAYANGYRLAVASVDHGPDLLVATFRGMAEELPDWKVQLFDEVAGKDDGVEKLAIRFVSSATIDEKYHEVEVAVFARVEDGKLTEWREVLDMTLANERRAASGLPLIE